MESGRRETALRAPSLLSFLALPANGASPVRLSCLLFPCSPGNTPRNLDALLPPASSFRSEQALEGMMSRGWLPASGLFSRPADRMDARPTTHSKPAVWSCCAGRNRDGQRLGLDHHRGRGGKSTYDNPVRVRRGRRGERVKRSDEGQRRILSRAGRWRDAVGEEADLFSSDIMEGGRGELGGRR